MTKVVMPRAIYDKRRRRRAGSHLLIAISLGLIFTLAVAMLCAMRSSTGPSLPKHGEQARETGFGVVVAFRGDRVRTVNSPAGPFSICEHDDQFMVFGWPVPALSYRNVYVYSEQGVSIKLMGGISGWTGQRYIGIPGRDIPLTPRPAGLLINTALAALPLYLLFGGSVDIRALRRTRRGLCPRCAYDARGLSHCPECGLETTNHSAPLEATQPQGAFQ